MTDPRFADIESHRPYLLRYALSQLRDGQLAEEAVQETLVSALESVGTFGGKSTLRTWLTSILRFKVVDLQRRAVLDRSRLAPTDFSAQADDESWLDELFDDTGHWLLCATHGAAYRPDTGTCGGGPCRGGLVKIDLSEHHGVVHWHTAHNLQPLEF